LYGQDTSVEKNYDNLIYLTQKTY